jgi:processive 1,2-diacylglycerol beta-glucosyltransferase
MNPDVKVLILYASYGKGHIQVSEALMKRFQDRGIRNIVLMDLFAQAHPFIDAISRYVYIKSFTILSSVYGWLYDRTKNMRYDTPVSSRFNAFGLRELRKIIEEEKPDLVINTFPMQAMAELCKQIGQKIPTYTVLTDFTIHNRWLHPGIDKYFVPTRDIKHKLVTKGIRPEKIKVSGIPLREGFEKPAPPPYSYDRFGLSPLKKTVLIMGGAYGVLADLKQLCEAISSINGVQVLLVCGGNEKLKKEMGARFAGNKDISVLGFVEDVHIVMRMASCVVTKAGGVTLSEALAVTLPIVIFRPVPGQEKENADYLSQAGAAITAEHTDELTNKISHILDDKQRLIDMKKAILRLQRRNAADTIITDIMSNIPIHH